MFRVKVQKMDGWTFRVKLTMDFQEGGASGTSEDLRGSNYLLFLGRD